jgi:hypothetical protein
VLLAVPDIPVVRVTAHNAIKVTVRYGKEMAGEPGTPAQTPPPPQLPPQLTALGSSHATAVPAAGTSRVSPTVQWLVDRAARDPRHASFKVEWHHVQTNVGVVSSWQFAVEFSEEFSGTVSLFQPVPVVGVSWCRSLTAPGFQQ